MGQWSRRHFMSALTSGLMGLGAKRALKAEDRNAGSPSRSQPELKIKKYNILGKTGLKVSDVGCGAISFFEPNVLRYAADLGVTYFDTAESYMNSNSEKYMGQALSGIRDKVIITTKHAYSPRKKITTQSILSRVENSLKRLKTDHVDIALVHAVSDLKLLQNEELLTAYARLKKDGKIRFTGFSTHNPLLTLKQALDSDFVQVVLVIYSHMQNEIEPLLKPLRDKGVGIVAMKIFAGGKHGKLKSLIGREISYPQAAIHWVLSNPNVNTCIPTMSSYAHVEEYVAASGQTLNRADLGVMADYKKEAGGEFCRIGCTVCENACPHGVAVNDILRYAMYFEDYGREKDAMQHYTAVDDSRKPLPCSECSGPCTSTCPYGLPVRDKLIHASEILSA